MSETRPAHDGSDMSDRELIQAIIKEAYAATPPEEVAADQLFNMFEPQEIIDACKESDIPSPWSNAVVNKLSDYRVAEKTEKLGIRFE